ncbi:Dipeptidyl aminopeptidases/acylaminoacyl-peptidase [Enhygromyxa salina]|uniref:Dipeptidyl aminopeptidases/acylaminoacyl-peptidase n=2 Tax=Enhygromyxa salina TaxID=215803 RepID=A0A0C2DE65_9BACT|nr:Dipeptidyl aminopeptidases/acylaminoacyl-peptidase [Enhygromyxa salina]
MAGRSIVVAAALVLGCQAPSADPGPSNSARAVVSPPPEVGPDPAPEPGPLVAPAVRYQQPDADVQRIIDAAPTPSVSLASDGRTMMLADYPAQPGIEVLAEPMLALAGERINPRTNERRRTNFYNHLRFVDVATGEHREVTGLPDRPQLSGVDWSPDAKHVAFTHTAQDHVELWVADVGTAKARRLTDAPLNASLDDGLVWLSGSERLLVSLVATARGPAPIGGSVAQGPWVEETSGRAATNRTYQDLLTSALDDALFTHYFSRELAIVTLDGAVTKLGSGDDALGVFTDCDPSPDGRWLLVERLVPPYSRVVPYYRFGHRVELWSLVDPGAAPIVLDAQPAAEEVPIQGVPTGPRGFSWQPLEGASLTFVEALDGGDPRAKAEHRDRLMRLVGPFAGKTVSDATEFTRLTHRYAGTSWLQQPGRYLVNEYDRDRKWLTTHLRELPREGEPASPGRVLFDRSVHDSYANPGDPVRINLPDDTWVVRVEGEGEAAVMFLDGAGATPQGDRPFLDRLALAPDSKPERLFQSPSDSWASFVGFAGDTSTAVLRREGPGDPPDWFREPLAGGEALALTKLPHPHPGLDGIHKQLLDYRRADGVPLSATLYLPPGYDPEAGERLPLVIWAYPVEYVDADTAGQVRAAPTRFTRLGGVSATMFLTQGYAVLFAAMPVVGDPETMNDTLLEQLELSAKAAIDAAVAQGVADRDRVGIGGHSYGAFMVANLLAHTDLFKAGIARSGAYNRSLTPFGFQSERRDLWEATDAYVRVSPLFSAATLNEPILMIHGEIDDNSGTYPIQTQRLFHALQGLGGVARMVILPHEAHGYRARESVLHTLYESFRWFDLYVKHPQEDRANEPG